MNLARTLALALILLIAIPQPAAASWANVRGMPPGIRIHIRTSDDTRAAGHDVIKGDFESVAEDSIVLRTKRKRQVIAIPKSRVVQIKVRIPLRSRKTPWIVSGATGTVMLILLPYGGFRRRGASWGDDIPQLFALLGIGITAGVSAFAFGRGNMKTIYPVAEFNLRKIQPPNSRKLTRPPARKQ